MVKVDEVTTTYSGPTIGSGKGYYIPETLVAYNWIRNKDRGTRSLLSAVTDMEKRIESVGVVAFSSAEKSGKAMEETLVSAGVNRKVKLKAWW